MKKKKKWKTHERAGFRSYEAPSPASKVDHSFFSGKSRLFSLNNFFPLSSGDRCSLGPLVNLILSEKTINLFSSRTAAQTTGFFEWILFNLHGFWFFNNFTNKFATFSLISFWKQRNRFTLAFFSGGLRVYLEQNTNFFDSTIEIMGFGPVFASRTT